ncbi:MAG: Hsp70 family protein [Rivularia sp. T60_A2020_040]|nr:Hsp70 family protein [Rivularia sp. T60_A2020_040]
MGKAIGIDLGTTNSVAAFKEAQIEVVSASDNTPPDRKLTRSIVALQQDKLMVGEKAYNQLRGEPENVIISIKRLMGRGFGDSAVQKQMSEIGYKIAQPTEGTDNSVAVWLGGKEYSPDDISAEIIKKVVQNARDYRGEIGKIQDIDQAVITIPAYFNDKQRHATRTAALKAGITPLELLPEPTAAAISYGFSPDSEDVKTILVYDFGGGTFDASLITAAGTQFIEQGKAGDLWLGGDDIDSRMINFVKQQVAEQEQIDDIDGLIAKMPYYAKVRFHADLKIAVERAKVQLSITNVARIQPATPLLDELGLAIPIEVEISREQFEQTIADLVESSIAICDQALQYSEYTADMVDVVLLVGGCSQIPYVQHQVKQAFGDKIVVHPRPMYAVAEGAAMVAAGLIDKVTTSSRDYYIELIDGKYQVISRGDILPVTTSHTFKTVADGQRLIHFRFFSPDQVRGEDESIGVLWLGLEAKYPPGTEILVNLHLDEKNSGLTVRATLKNDPSVSVSHTFSRGNSDEKIYQDLETAIAELNNQSLTEFGVEEALRLSVPVVQLANEIIDPRNGQERIDLRERAKVDLENFQAAMSKERLEAEYNVNQCNQIVELCGFMIPQPQQLRLQNLSQELLAAINSHNISQMQSLNEDVTRELKNLPSEVQLVQGCLFAIQQAHRVEPTQANAMSEKLYRMLDASSKSNEREVDRLWNELQPSVNRWFDMELSTNTIATGLKR